MTLTRHARTWLLALLWSGCSNLPELRQDECGNGVIEPSEDCDTFDVDGVSCRPKNAIGACHLDCSRELDGVRSRCPAGWGCDRDDLCRAPSGSFEPARVARVNGAFSLSAADLDGDGQDELLAGTAPNELGDQMLRVHYFDAQGVLADTRSFARRVRSSVVTEVSRDHQSDIAFATTGVGLLLGRADRSLVPEAFSSYGLPDTRLRTLSVGPGLIAGAAALLSLTTLGNIPGIYAVDGANMSTVIKRADFAGSIETLAGDPATAQIIESSACHELVYAMRGATSFQLVDACTRDPGTAQLVWRQQAEQWSIALDPPLAIESAPQVGDIDGDGHLDVLVGSTRQTYVAYGDGQRLNTAVPYRPLYVEGNPSAELPMPLAAGDFTGDSKVDFVLPEGLLVSKSTSDTRNFEASYLNRAAPWTVAKIADLNGNGRPDVVAGSSARPGLDFFSGTATATLIPFYYPTAAPVAQLGTGDFDGDSIGDVALVAGRSDSGSEHLVMIGYGVSQQPPSSLAVVARIQNAEHLTVNEGAGLFSHLGVSSSATLAGRLFGVVTWLYGSPERVPLAPYDLLPLPGSASVGRYVPASVIAGKFSGGDQAQLLALAAEPASGDLRFWLVPTLSGPSRPQLLEGELDPELEPLHILEREIRGRSVEGTSADLDGDGRSEALWVMPAKQRQACAIAIFGTEALAMLRLRPRATLVLDRPCSSPALAATDVDGDSRPELLLLTGAGAQAERTLLVLWNDGAGNFAAGSATPLNQAGDAPGAFTTLRGPTPRSFSVAYVTERALMISQLQAGTRLFSPPQPLAALTQGTGVAAADLNGDRITDLAVADAGDLSVFLAGVVR